MTTIVENFSIIKNGICPDIEIIQHDESGFFNITKVAKHIKNLNISVDSPNKLNRPRKWFENASTTKLIEECKRITKLDNVCISMRSGVPIEYIGTYVHRLLYDHFMIWLDPVYALQASSVLQAYHSSVIKKVVTSVIVCNSIECNSIIYTNIYNGYCLKCFEREYPNDRLVHNRRFKEMTIMNDIKSKYNEIILNKPIMDNSCLRRPDGLLKRESHNIMIEIDEHQHKNYSDDYERILEIYDALNCIPLVVVRFNPDEFNGLDNGLFSMCEDTKVLSIRDEDAYKNAMNELLNTIDMIYRNDMAPCERIQIIKIRFDHLS